MADGITVQLVGRDDTVAALRAMRENVVNNVVRNALKDGAQLLYEALLRYAPYRTGKLARNLNVRTMKSGNYQRARVTVNTIGKASNSLNAFYWRFLEYGWHDRAGREHSEPFIAPATAGHEQEAAQVVIDAVGAAIDAAGK